MAGNIFYQLLIEGIKKMFLERFLAEFSFDLSVFIFDIIIPCMLALVFGGLIGLQRERHERPAGLRTHALVCLGATVFTLVSYLGFSSGAGFDSTRIAAGVVTGIGFIGAGVIFRQGILVKGVTTAASIWIVAAIGQPAASSVPQETAERYMVDPTDRSIPPVSRTKVIPTAMMPM